MDPVSIVAIISSVSALTVAVLTHIRYSSCFGCKIVSAESKTPIETTPIIKQPPK